MSKKALSPQKRADHLAQVNANCALDGQGPSAQDLQLQKEYVAGTKTVSDLLDHARQQAARAQQQ